MSIQATEVIVGPALHGVERLGVHPQEKRSTHRHTGSQAVATLAQHPVCRPTRAVAESGAERRAIHSGPRIVIGTATRC